jgi:alkanesulfonate monooxygenase SsuD/methylene tetrahydromethanopterin reductase-like flavin-dependent oxidoreductase (luciferase family)
MTAIKVGVTLPGPDAGSGAPSLAVAARHAEDLGLDSVWLADLIIGDGTPTVECVVAAATAAAVTRRVGIGFGVLVLPLRPVAWTAAQIAALQHLSGDRVLLGVGAGGFPGAPFWRAAGVTGRERGKRTDAALDVLPGLIAGHPVAMEDGAPALTLGPPATVPPILVGGNSPAALSRAVTRGLDWFPSLLTPASLQEHARRAEPGFPPVTVGGHARVGEDRASREARAGFVRTLTELHRMPPATAEQIPVAGSPAQVTEKLAAFGDVGAERVVLSLDGPDWMGQAELLAQAAAGLG